MAFLLLNAACFCVFSQNGWNTIFLEDFGGNSVDAPTAGPVNSHVWDRLEFVDAFSDVSYGGDYTITKHYDKNVQWYQGGDHTYPNDKEVGYFMIVNPDASQATHTCYSQEVTGLKMGETYRFSVWTANMMQPNTAGSEQLPYLSISVCEGDQLEMPIARSAYASLVLPVSESSTANQCLDWQELSFEFRLDQDIESAYIMVNMEAPEAMGWDFALDDIRFEVYGGTTGVEDLSHDEDPADGQCYDLWGRRVEPQSGSVFVKNGKKYIRKQ